MAVIRIFICYSQDDFKARGVKLRNYLSKVISNSEVYIDQSKKKGEKWRKVNEEKLKNSDIVLVILTPAALQSNEVKREIKLAKKSDTIIIPCKDENLELEWDDVPWNLGELDGIEFEDDEVLKTRLYKEIKKIIKTPPKGKKLVKVVNEIIKIKETKTKSFTIDAILVEKGSIPIKVNDQFYELPYSIRSGPLKFQSAKMDKDALSVIINVDCTEDSTFDLTLPRSLIDSKLGSKDDIFFVMIDVAEVKYSEKVSSKDRTLTISVPSGTGEIEIVGTQLLGISFAGVTKPQNAVTILQGSSVSHGGKYLDPEILTVKVGDKVRWENNDLAAHTVTSGNQAQGSDARFDSGLFMSGNNFEVTFNEKGTYDYFCMVHPWKAGKIVVK